MVTVYLIDYVYEEESGSEHTRPVGVYSSLKTAEQARDRLRCSPEFADKPGMLEISEKVVNRDNWTEGFVTVIGDQMIES